MAIDIDVSTSGIGAAIARLTAMHARAQVLTPVLIKAKQEVKLANAANFTSNGLLVGGWAPLDAQYASWKMARFPGMPPMVRTGKLFASLSGAAGSINTMTPTSFSIGTSVEYAKFHQYGTSKMAKRKIVFEPPLFAKKIGRDTVDYIANGEVL
jgi:phage gpG-like protein